MRITAFLLILAMQVSAAGFTQITLSEKNVPLEKVFKAIETQSEYVFFYDYTLLQHARTVNIKVKNAQIAEVLNKCFKDQPLTFIIIGKTVVVKQKEELESNNQLSVEKLLIQNIAITGTVTDVATGKPLVGATINLKNTNTSTTTDENGYFTLEAPANGNILVISYVGYETTEVIISTAGPLKISLKQKETIAEDVVVIGYGESRKKNLTGAVSSVNVTKMNEIPIVSVDQLLSGRAAGVQINQSSGAAGAGTSIRIRGGNSLNGTNEPLFVVDGFPIINDNGALAAPDPLGLTNTLTGTNQGNPNGVLNWLNPADIESIEVLKDASSTAIYGSRGANGVIMITTKKGKARLPKVNISSAVGVSYLNEKNIRLMGAKDFANYANLTRINQGLFPFYTDTTINGKYYPSPEKVGAGTNWLDAIKQKGVTQNYSLDLSGGDAVLYSGSVAWLDQETPIMGSKIQRLSTRLSLSTKLNNWLSVENSLAYSQIKIDNGPSDTRDPRKFGAWEAALQANPVEPIYNVDGSYNYTGGDPIGANLSGLPYNPVAMIKDDLNRNSSSTFLNNLSLKAAIAKGVNFEVRGSIFNNDLLRDIYYNSKTSFNGLQVGGLAGKNTNRVSTYLIENFVKINKSFGNNNFNAVGGYSYQNTQTRIVQMGASGFPNDLLKNENMGAGNTQYPSQTIRIEDLLSSVYVRLNNIFNNKYIFTFTARLDGSSKFGSENKWASFPSGAIAWRLKEEKFLKNSQTFSDLKLRIGYGLIGNQAISSLQSRSLLGLNNYPIGGILQTGVYPSVLGNPKLKWEVTEEFNAGLDFGFFNQRLTGSVNIYSKNTSDLLQQLSVPTNSGFSTVFSNVGSISNKGIELELQGSIIKNTNFKWDINANISHNIQKLTELGLPSDTLIVNASYFLPTQVALIEGQPVGLFFGYVWDGIFKDMAEIDKFPHLPGTQPGDIRFRDVNNDGVINENDRTVIGDPNPTFTYGFMNNFSYKNLDLNIMFQGVAGGDIYDEGASVINGSDRLDYWSSSNPNAKFPAPGLYTGSSFKSSFYVSDGSYLRLKSMNVGYNFSFSKLKSMRSIRLYAAATNLFTITNFKGFDPEVNSYGQNNIFRNISSVTIPPYRTFTIGINIGL